VIVEVLLGTSMCFAMEIQVEGKTMNLETCFGLVKMISSLERN